ncbi:F22 [Felid gammaherpesvirus 1]|uniref:F22 n=1 Tax=Felid gammaherpesvirus 1 TaxID=2560468 RepID=A0A0M3T968_9GAMA|nr:F22 [Felis catus gammaherpesvirus 1]ALE14772.1 F22 [Felis catus gammaherpesvirus 1]
MVSDLHAVAIMSHTIEDKYKYIWIVFLILSLCSVLPWNVYITATSYFTSKLINNISLITPPNSTNYSSILEGIFTNSITLCAVCSVLIFTCFSPIIQENISEPVRIAGSLLGILGIFLFTSFLVLVPMEITLFFIIILITVILANSLGSILQASVFNLVSLFPSIYTHAFIVGQGLAGLYSICIMLLITSTGLPLTDSTFIYFIVASAIFALSIFLYFTLHTLRFFKMFSIVKKPYDAFQHIPLVKHNARKKFKYKNLFMPATSICALYVTTIGVFPSVAVDIKPSTLNSTTEITTNQYFVPIICFLNYSIWELIGRMLTMFIIWPKKTITWIPLLVCFRIVLIPLILFCNIHPRHNLPVYFLNPGWFALFIGVLALSNGYFTSLCIITMFTNINPKRHTKPPETVINIIMVLGSAIGAIISFLLKVLL